MATSRTPHDVAQEFLGALEDADNLQEFLTREDLGLGSKSSVEYTLRLLDRRVVDEEAALHELLKSKASELQREVQSWRTAQSGLTRLDETLESLKGELNSVENDLDEMTAKKPEWTDKARAASDRVQWLEAIQKMHEGLAEYDEKMGDGDYYTACCILMDIYQSKDVLKRMPATLAGSTFLVRFDGIHQGFNHSLEYIVEQFLQVTCSSENQIEISIMNSVELGPGIPRAQASSSLAAALALQRLTSFLDPFCKYMLSKVLPMLCKSYDFKFEPSQKREKYGLRLLMQKTSEPGNILSNLDTLLDSLYSQISLICSESPRKELESNIWTAFGELFYSKVAALLLDTCIKDLTPLTYNEVLEFPKRIGSLCFNFEEKWAAKGMIQNDKRPITEYCKNISFRFIKRKRDALLSETRSICLSRDYDYSIIEGHVIRDELDGETVSEIDGLFVFPKCAISHKVAKTKELLESALNEMLEMDDSCAKSLFESCRRMLDLYRILLKDSDPYSSLPVMAMVLFNDFLYLQNQCLLLPLHFPRLPNSFRLADRAGMFRQDALTLYQTQMDFQKNSLREILGSVPNLHIHNQHHLQAIERMLHQVAFHIRSVSQPWSTILSSHMHKRALGELLSFCFDNFIKGLEELRDITEKESRDLHQLLSRFKEFTADFKTRDPDEILDYIPSFRKFLLIVDILEMNMADIMSLFRQGRLSDFSSIELVNLIKALFAETPLRSTNLLEITSASARSL